MKKNSLTLILVLIIFLLVGYIIYDKLKDNEVENNLEDETISIIDSISLDYVDIYLTNDGLSYIVPLNKEKINKLDVHKNLKDRLNTLYERAFYFDIYINNNKLKGFKVKLDSDITRIRKIVIDDLTYIAFIKENNTLGLFNYGEYYDLLYTNVIDNYNKYQNIKDIKENEVIYLDGSKESFELEK